MPKLSTRVHEPEHMTEEEELCYAEADYSIPHEVLAREIVEKVGQGDKRAIDIGSGPGDVLLRIRRLAQGWTLFGADISTQMLSLALNAQADRLHAENRSVNWVLTDGRRFGFADGEFDVIISNSVLHHVADAAQFWREIKRIAHDGTHVFVRDLRRPADETKAKDLVELHVGREAEVVKRHYFSSLLSAYRCDEVRNQLVQAGIAGLDVRELEDRYLTVEGVLRK